MTSFERMAESKPIREIAYETLKHAIITGEIPAGSRIVETDYAERMHISRTPLREALRKLEQDGLVSFEVTVSHPGIALKDVVIRETSQGKLESIQMLPSGDHLFKYSIRVSQSGSYQFSLSAKDENDVTVLALADPVEITVDMRRAMNSVMMQPVGSAPAAPAPKRARVETAVLFCVAALMVLSAVFLAVLIWRERISKPRR